MLANYGHDVSGYDIDDQIRTQLQNGDCHLNEPGLRAFVTQALKSDNLAITDEVISAAYQIICVPTPFDEESKSADLTYIEEVGRALAPRLREGDTVVLESTVPPGTTEDKLQPLLERGGLVAGVDFALAHCPETVLPGNTITELRENTRIVGGVNAVSAESAARLYETFVNGEIQTTDNPTVTEFVKLIQNASRDVNIAFANEIARLARDYHIDSREAIRLANMHPRVEILQPGPGVGGHCLPIDPWFLGTNSDELDLIATARSVNDSMTEFIIELLREELDELNESKIAILGVAYKGNVSDTRMSPGLRLARQLGGELTPMAADGGTTNECTVSIHDPHVTDPTLALSDFESAIADADAIVLTADHDEYKKLEPEAFNERMSGNVVVDTKACFDVQEWHEAGFTMLQV